MPDQAASPTSRAVARPKTPRAAMVPRVLRIGADWSWRFLVVAAAILVVVALLVRVRVVVIPVFVALLLAALISPIVELLARRMPRLAAMWVTILGGVGAFLGLGALLFRPLESSIEEVSSEYGRALDDVEEWLQTGPLDLSAERVDELRTGASEAAERLASGFLERPSEFAVFAIDVVAGFLLALVLAFFFAKDGPEMWRWGLDHLKPARRDAADRAGRAAFKSLQGWLRGTAITGVVDGVIIGVALLVLDVPAAIPLAIITFFAAFLPIIGATLAGAAAAAIALAANGPTTAIIVVVVVLVVQQVEGDVLMPLVMRRHVSLHPAVILVALAIGSAIAGIVGALMAVPITAALSAAVAALNPSVPDPPEAESGSESETAGTASA